MPRTRSGESVQSFLSRPNAHSAATRPLTRLRNRVVVRGIVGSNRSALNHRLFGLHLPFGQRHWVAFRPLSAPANFPFSVRTARRLVEALLHVGRLAERDDRVTIAVLDGVEKQFPPSLRR